MIGNKSVLVLVVLGLLLVGVADAYVLPQRLDPPPAPTVDTKRRAFLINPNTASDWLVCVETAQPMPCILVADLRNGFKYDEKAAD